MNNLILPMMKFVFCTVLFVGLIKSYADLCFISSL
jgi:hypothetical protein